MRLIEKVIMPSLEVFAEMEYEGLNVDTNTLERVGKTLSSKNMDERTVSIVAILYTRQITSHLTTT